MQSRVYPGTKYLLRKLDKASETTSIALASNLLWVFLLCVCSWRANGLLQCRGHWSHCSRPVVGPPHEYPRKWTEQRILWSLLMTPTEAKWSGCGGEQRDQRGAWEMQVGFDAGEIQHRQTQSDIHDRIKRASYLKCSPDHHCWGVRPLALTLCMAALAPQHWKCRLLLGRGQRLRGYQCTSGTLHAVLVSSFPKGCKTSEKGSEDKEITICGAACLTNVQVRNSSWELERQLKDVRTYGGLAEQVAHSLVVPAPERGTVRFSIHLRCSRPCSLRGWRRSCWVLLNTNKPPVIW